MDYPLSKFHFMVEWGGTRISASEITGLSAEFGIVEYPDGSSRLSSSSLMPGLMKPNRITLKRGVVKGDNEYFEWLATANFNTIEKRDLVIKLLDENHEPLLVWYLSNAFPVKLEWSDLKALTSEPVIESLEVVYEKMAVENG
mgnify:CR=1 FL=1